MAITPIVTPTVQTMLKVNSFFICLISPGYDDRITRSEYGGMGLKIKLSMADLSPFLASLPICLEHVRAYTASMLARPYRKFVNLDDNLSFVSALAPVGEDI